MNDKDMAQAYVEYKQQEQRNRQQAMSFNEFKNDMKKQVDTILTKKFKDLEKALNKKK